MADDIDEMGPIDYIVLEWPDGQPSGEAGPLIIDAHEKGIIRILDVAFLAKDETGAVASVELGALNGGGGLSDFEGASTGLIGQDELDDAAEVLQPGTFAAVLVWENRWAAPIATAIRRSGGQLVAAGHIPVQAILAQLDALEALASEGS